MASWSSIPARSRRCSSAPPQPAARRPATRSRTTPTAAPASTATSTPRRSRASVRRSRTTCRCRTSCATAAATTRRDFVYFDVNQYLAALTALDGQPILDENGDPTGEVYDSSLVAPEFNPVQSYDVDEDTIAAYVSANFAGEDWFANAGLRWIDTDTTARTAIDRIVRVDDPTPGVPTSSPDVTYSVGGAVHREGQLQQAAAVAQRRLLAARRPAAARRGRPGDIAALAQPAGADPHRRHARPHLRGVLRRKRRPRAGRGRPGRPVDRVVLRRQVGAERRRVLEGPRRLHHLRAAGKRRHRRDRRHRRRRRRAAAV